MSLIGRVKSFFGQENGDGFMIGGAIPTGLSTSQMLNTNKGIVYLCVSAISEQVGRYQPVIKDKVTGDILPTHPLNDLFRTPNDDQKLTTSNLFEVSDALTSLVGEFFWYIPQGTQYKKPMQIIPMRADRVQVATGLNGKIEGYVYRKPSGGETTLDIKDVLHHKIPNPANPSRGLGVVQASEVYIQTEQYSARWTRNFIFNNARPSGILSFKKTIDKEQFDKIKKRWNEEYGTIDHAGKIAFVNGTEMEYQKLGVGLDEISLDGLKKMTKEDIMMMFKVSKPIIGITDDVNYNNGRNAKKIFVENVIKPRMERLTDTLNQYFNQYYPEVVIDFVDPTISDPAERADFYAKASDVFMTRNEIRAELELPPISNGDSLFIPINLMELGKPAEQKKAMKKKVKVAVKKKDEVAEVQDVDPIDEEATKKAEIRKKIDELKLAQWKSFVTLRNGYLKKIKAKADEVVAQQRADVLSKMQPKKSSESDIIQWLFNADEYNEVWKSNLMPLFIGLAQEQGKLASEQIGAEPYKMSEEMTKYMEDRTGKWAKGFDEQTIESLTKSLQEGITNGESLAKLKARVEDEFDGSKTRTERVARTETIKMSNRAAVDAYKQTEYITEKQWYTNPDGCQYCAGMDGTTVEIDKEFVDQDGTVVGIEGGEMVASFESIEEPPLHPNCECKILPYNQEFEDTGNYFFSSGE